MAIADTITSMQTHTSNAYTMIAYATDLTGINKNLANLKQCIFDSLINSMSDTLNTTWNNLPKITTTPGTTQSINNTTEAPMKIELGANELSQSATPTPTSPQAIHTITGENTIKVVGKNLLSIPFTQYATNNCRSEIPNFKAGTYTFSIVMATPAGNQLTARKIVNGTTTQILAKYNTTNITFTLDEDATLQLEVYKSGLVLSDFSQPMLNIGSSSATYEPYKGNSYEINLGKNLAYTGWASNFVSRINNTSTAKLETKDGKNCLYWIASAGYNDYDNKYIFKINWKTNTQYTISCDIFSSNISGYGNLCIEYTDGTTTEINGTYNTWVHKTITSTSGKTIKYIRPYYRADGTYLDLDTFMIEQGSTATSYSPYFPPIELCKIGDYKDEFIKTSGKNLFDGSTITPFNANTNVSFTNETLTYANNNSYDVSITLMNLTLTETTNLYASINTASTKEIAVYSGNTYVNSLLTTSQTSNNITLNAGTYAIKTSSPTNGTLTLKQLMISKENVSYEPYGKNEWWLKKEIGKVVLDGSEGWTYFSFGSYFYNSTILANYPRSATKQPIKFISNMYIDNNTVNVPSSATDFLTLVQQPDRASEINLKNINYSVPNDLKTWLSEHNVIIYYVLATPTYTKINIVDLVYQLEAIRNSNSQNNQTNINQENTDLAFILNTTAIDKQNLL